MITSDAIAFPDMISSMSIGGRIVAPTEPFKKLFFLEAALKFKAAMPDYPFIYVGGVVDRQSAGKVIDAGFPLLQMGRAVLEDTDFVNKMKADPQSNVEFESRR